MLKCNLPYQFLPIPLILSNDTYFVEAHAV
jgi:hypothetical protein